MPCGNYFAGKYRIFRQLGASKTGSFTLWRLGRSAGKICLAKKIAGFLRVVFVQRGLQGAATRGLLNEGQLSWLSISEKADKQLAIKLGRKLMRRCLRQPFKPLHAWPIKRWRRRQYQSGGEQTADSGNRHDAPYKIARGEDADGSVISSSRAATAQAVSAGCRSTPAPACSRGATGKRPALRFPRPRRSPTDSCSCQAG